MKKRCDFYTISNEGKSICTKIVRRNNEVTEELCKICPVPKDRCKYLKFSLKKTTYFEAFGLGGKGSEIQLDAAICDFKKEPIYDFSKCNNCEHFESEIKSWEIEGEMLKKGWGFLVYGLGADKASSFLEIVKIGRGDSIFDPESPETKEIVERIKENFVVKEEKVVERIVEVEKPVEKIVEKVPKIDEFGKVEIIGGSVSADSTGNTINFIFTAGTQMKEGELSITIPDGWSSPQSEFNVAGYITISSTGAIGSYVLSDREITIPIIKLATSGTIVVSYINATAQHEEGEALFKIMSKIDKEGKPKQLEVPGIIVNARDGSGRCSLDKEILITGVMETLTFTFTSLGRMSDGEIVIHLPTSEWPNPQGEEPSNEGYVDFSSSGKIDHLSFEPQRIIIPIILLQANDTVEVNYSNIKIPDPPGEFSFIISSRSSRTGRLKELSESPKVTIIEMVDGSGVCEVSGSPVSAGSLNNELRFIFTSTSPMKDGTVSITIPPLWSSPQGTKTNLPGFITCKSTGKIGPSLEFSTQSVSIPVVELANGDKIEVVYSNVQAPPKSCEARFLVKSKASVRGHLKEIETHPVVWVNARDGAGACTILPRSLSAKSSGNKITIIFIASGRMDTGEISIEMPDGWSSPQGESQTREGYVTCTTVDKVGELTFSDQRVNIPIISLNGGERIILTYSNVTVQPTPYPNVTFVVESKGSASGNLLEIEENPWVAVNTFDGSGICTVTPTCVSSESLVDRLIFSFKSTGIMDSGAISIETPDGWFSPQNRSERDPGYTVATAFDGKEIRNLEFSENRVVVPIDTLGKNQKINVTFQNVVIPETRGLSKFVVYSKASESGKLKEIGKSPEIMVNVKDGSGRCSVDKEEVISGSKGNTLIFTFTAEGTMSGGSIRMVIPKDWSRAQGVDEEGEGYITISSSGSTLIPTIHNQSEVIDIPIIYAEDSDTITIKYSNVKVQQSTELVKFKVESKGSPEGNFKEIEDSPTIKVVKSK
ncbi:MAG: hypothetical protein QME40_00985 [bacterium]|nr:hypothetical protein [bacterium]